MNNLCESYTKGQKQKEKTMDNKDDFSCQREEMFEEKREEYFRHLTFIYQIFITQVENFDKKKWIKIWEVGINFK